MRIGGLLRAQGLVTAQDVERAVARQAKRGGRLGENLVAIGAIAQEDLERVFRQAPIAPRSVADAGIASTNLLRLMAKSMAVDGFETPAQLMERLKLPYSVIQGLIQFAMDKQLLETLPAHGIRQSDFRYGLTRLGRQLAADALEQSSYVGPAPVSLAAYCAQVLRQRISNERIDRNSMVQHFRDLVVPEAMVRKLGPAINSMRSMLLYGAPGNGKTSIAEKIGAMFRDIVYIPYCFEVEGQIIKVYDPSLHLSPPEVSSDVVEPESVHAREFDQRWVPCRRPLAITGGELTLEMLDLQFSHIAKFYEAPLHVKAMNGIFLVDDFGRQIVRPGELLNRWIVPLESRVDYMKLHTGNSFQLPFDEFVIFSTNMTPDDLVDPAFLRRIPYKLEIQGPSLQDYRKVFDLVCNARSLELSDEMVGFVVDQLLHDKHVELAFYQPKFICDQVIAACKFEGIEPKLTKAKVADALDNLYVNTADNDTPVKRISPARVVGPTTLRLP